MANKILVARGTKARLEEIKSTLAANELVYSTDTGELGVKKASGDIEYFMNATDINEDISTKEDSVNKVDNLNTPNNTTFGTTLAVKTYIDTVVGEEFTQSEKIKLSGIEVGAEVNPYSKTQLDNMLDDKVDKVSGKGLSTNDYTTTEKNKLSGIETGAQVNVAIATTTQAQAGENNTSVMTPLRVKESVTANARSNTWTPTWSQVSGKPSFATVATSGSYNDLTNKPTIPAGTVTNVSAGTTQVSGLTLSVTNGTTTPTITTSISNAANFRAAIGAGTGSSNLTIGTTSSTAKAGNYQPTWSQVTSKPTNIIRQVSFSGGTMVIEVI